MTVVLFGGQNFVNYADHILRQCLQTSPNLAVYLSATDILHVILQMVKQSEFRETWQQC
jgi:hypothetical protein